MKWRINMCAKHATMYHKSLLRLHQHSQTVNSLCMVHAKQGTIHSQRHYWKMKRRLVLMNSMHRPPQTCAQYMLNEAQYIAKGTVTKMKKKLVLMKLMKDTQCWPEIQLNIHPIMPWCVTCTPRMQLQHHRWSHHYYIRRSSTIMVACTLMIPLVTMITTHYAAT